LFDLFATLGFGPFQDDDGAEEAFANFPLTVHELGPAGVELSQLPGAFLKFLLLALEEE
jgi:hypothetical protein